MPSNRAAWLVAERKKPLEVGPAPFTAPGEHEIVIKNHAVAINPVNWIMQDPAPFPLQYPTILGNDCAGEVVEVGSKVTRFRKGDRVLGHAVAKSTHKDYHSAFQEYVVLLDNMASPIPSTLSFEAACAIPLGLSTAAYGMYLKSHLALQYPSVNPNPTGQTFLVYGGSTSVGSNGIQLGVASGYEVFATASSKNFEYCKKLGATQVLDYNSKTIVEDLVEALKGKTIAGVLDCVTQKGAVEICAEFLRKSEGHRNIATVLMRPEELPGGVKTKFILAADLRDYEVSKVVYEDFLPQALAEGKYVAAPEPIVVGKGLESIQDGLEAQKKGVSAKKVVITL